jgi:AAA+ superfamily predicted ATPase
MVSKATLLWSPLTPIRIGSVLAGTGKTMTVNAVANELGKKVLLVDFGGLAGRKSEGAGNPHHTTPHHRSACMSSRPGCLS